MEYRLVRLDDDNDEYVQIYKEQEAELIGSGIKVRKYLLGNKYLVRINENTYEMHQGLFFRRIWKISPGDLKLKFKWKVLGKGVKIIVGDTQYTGKEINRGKLTISNEKGRTALIIDRDSLKSEEMVLLEEYERIDPELVIVASILITERYKLW